MSYHGYRSLMARNYNGALLSIGLLAATAIYLLYVQHEKRKVIASLPTYALEVDEEKILIGREPDQIRRLWGYFTHFAETRHIFVLHMDEYRTLVIPKRAFHSPQESQDFARLARVKILRDSAAPDNTMPHQETKAAG